MHISSPVCGLYGNLSLGYDGGAVIKVFVDLVKLVLLSL